MAISHTMRKYHETEGILERLENGTIAPENYDRYVAMAALQAKLLSVEISAQKLAMIDGKQGHTVKRLQNSGFISSTSIPSRSYVTEVFPCRERGGCSITRNECLDYSGDTRHLDACQKCDQFTATRKQICP